jgi:hypothetical protein
MTAAPSPTEGAVTGAPAAAPVAAAARSAERRLLLVWWSNTGGTRALFESAQTGAQWAARDAMHPIRVEGVRCDAATPEMFLQADAFVLACPECLGSVAGPMKTLLDQCYYPLLGQIAGRAWSALICAGSDGEGALRLLRRVALGWGLRETVPALRVLSGEQTPEAILAPTRVLPQDLARAHELGATMVAGLDLGLW